jgi:hypothetical protein
VRLERHRIAEIHHEPEMRTRAARSSHDALGIGGLYVADDSGSLRAYRWRE